MQRSSSGGRLTAYEALQHATSQAKVHLNLEQLDSLLSQIAAYRKEAEEAEKDGNMDLLLQFLQYSRNDKARKLEALQRELACLESDIGKVEGTVLVDDATANESLVVEMERSVTQGGGHLLSVKTETDYNSSQQQQQQEQHHQLPGTLAMQQAALATAQQQQLMQQRGLASNTGGGGGGGERTAASPKWTPPGGGWQEAPQPPPATAAATPASHEAALTAAMQRVGPQYSANAYKALAVHPGMATYMATQFTAAAGPHTTTTTTQNTTTSNATAPSPLPLPMRANSTTTTTTNDEDRREALAGIQNRNKRRRIAAQFEDLQSAYLRLRADRLRSGGGVHASSPSGSGDGDATAPTLPRPDGAGGDDAGGAAPTPSQTGALVDEGLQEFSRLLSSLSRCNKLRTVAEIPRPSLRQSSLIISSVEFDREGALFATAGVSKRISVFEHAAIVRTPGTLVHCPVIEMVTRSKLSCLSWNKYIASHLASSDYEGVVTVWDVNTSAMIQEYEAHAKRIWSVDFCGADPTLLASGSDDCTVKLWSTRAQASVAQLELRANVCAVKWRTGSAHQIAVGSADHCVYLYDLRRPATPVTTFAGHRKAVSYVRWSGENEIVSASTDSTLRLWSANGPGTAAGDSGGEQRIFEGHVNEKNFVGLAVEGEYLACGSETNEAFVYFRPLSKPVARLGFADGGLYGGTSGGGGSVGTAAAAAGGGDGGAVGDDKPFVSAVCWRPGGQELLVADSQGTLRILELSGSG